MAEAIRSRNIIKMNETANICELMDKWFDCLNGRHTHQGNRTRNHNLDPYYNVDDSRLWFFMEEFLGYINDWEDEVDRIADLSASEKNRLKLSYQTVEGLRITSVSFVALVQDLFADGAKFILPEKLNQIS